ncbi:DUF4397 domain-containing protein [Mucilaginibacter sp.]|uniref:DUF4397 domain-containing protein n=1 Tax=Mucilaginibacter sp. TaxID=1882438 RepID=UPI0035BC18CE
MINTYKGGILFYLALFVAGSMFLPMLASCGKDNGTTLNTANAQVNLINVSPDVLPFNLYSRLNTSFVQLGTTNYTYPTASGYFLLNVAETPFLLRPSRVNNLEIVNLLPEVDTFQRNVRYTWFVTGLRADSSLSSVIITDTSSLPAIGRGKIRFVNVSPNAPPLNLTANDTTAFRGIGYKGVSKFIEVTAGNYNFNVVSSAAPGIAIKSMRNVPILDGRLYTVYAYGLTGRQDTAAFNTNIILNTVPLKYN